MELLTKLGIDWRLLIAQLVNFLILVLILYKFLYKPLLKMLEGRKEKIEKGLRDAEQLGVELEKTKELQAAEIQKAKQESRAIIEEAERRAEAAGAETKLKTKAEVEKLISAAKNQIISEKEKMMAEVKKEAIELVLATAKKVVGKVIDNKVNKELIENTIHETTKR
ncbi:F0F1 ATP synthase subunit B [Candidatus Falkowbacteria bacterium]|nr:F0F1 ATP synthase subunit B [Candidatus Falkowbacteria bacterium]